MHVHVRRITTVSCDCPSRQVDPAKLDLAGYQCLRNFFETINIAERKLKKVSAAYHSIVSPYTAHCLCMYSH